MAILHDERHVLGRPHPVDRMIKHGRQVGMHAHEATFGTARRAGRVARNVGKILLFGTLASAATGFGFSEAHSLFGSTAGVTQEPWPVLIGVGGEVATLGTATVVGALGVAGVMEHYSKHSAEFTARAAETSAVGVEAGIDALFHGGRHVYRRARSRMQRPTA